MSQVTNSKTAFTGNVICTPIHENNCNRGKIKRGDVCERSRDYTKLPLYFFKHNEIFLTMKCFESCMYAST